MAAASEKAKMLAGELYNASGPELLAERRRAQQLLTRYNATGGDDAEERMTVLRQLFGAIGEGADIQPRFACDYGYNIRMGSRCFVNYNCVFLDCAPIEIGDDLQMRRGCSSMLGPIPSIAPPAPPAANTPSQSASAAVCGSAAV
jgi:maltose O-acetyltransferase